MLHMHYSPEARGLAGILWEIPILEEAGFLGRGGLFPCRETIDECGMNYFEYI